MIIRKLNRQSEKLYSKTPENYIRREGEITIVGRREQARSLISRKVFEDVAMLGGSYRAATKLEQDLKSSRKAFEDVAMLGGSYRAATKLEQIRKKRALRKTLKGNRIIKQLNEKYITSHTGSLLNFLNKYEHLTLLALEAYDEIRKYFPSECLNLEVVPDLDEVGREELFIYILTLLPVEEALQKLNDLDEQWLLKKIDATDGLFNLNLKFV